MAGQFARVLVDGKHRHRCRSLPGAQQVAAGLIDAESARPVFGLVLADPGQRAMVAMHSPRRQHARLSLAGVEEAAVRRQVNIRRLGFFGMALGHLRDGLDVGQFAGGHVVAEGLHRRVELIDQIDKARVGMKGEMPRPGPVADPVGWRIVGRQHAGAFIEAPLDHHARVAHRGQHEAVRMIDLNTVRRRHVVFDHHRAFLHLPARADRVDAHRTLAKGGTEQKPAALIDGDAGHAVNDIDAADFRQDSAEGIDAETGDLRLRVAQRGIEIAAVRADGQRHNLGAGRMATQRRQPAIRRIKPEDADLAAVRTRHINKGGGGGHGDDSRVVDWFAVTMPATDANGPVIPILAGQKAATPPSLRGSVAPSITPDACRTNAPAWPMTESNGPTTSMS